MINANKQLFAVVRPMRLQASNAIPANTELCRILRGPHGIGADLIQRWRHETMARGFVSFCGRHCLLDSAMDRISYRTGGIMKTNIETGGMIRHARAELKLSQTRFGVWLAAKVGRDTPYVPQVISDWECGRKQPCLKVRRACKLLAARHGMRMLETDRSTDIVIDCQS